MSTLRRLLVLSVLWLTSLGNNFQSTIAPGSPQAAAVPDMWWVFFIILMTVYVIVMVLLVIGLFRRRGQVMQQEPLPLPVPDAEDTTETESDARAKRSVILGLGLTGVILMSLLIVSYGGNRELHASDL